MVGGRERRRAASVIRCSAVAPLFAPFENIPRRQYTNALAQSIFSAAVAGGLSLFLLNKYRKYTLKSAMYSVVLITIDADLGSMPESTEEAPALPVDISASRWLNSRQLPSGQSC